MPTQGKWGPWCVYPDATLPKLPHAQQQDSQSSINGAIRQIQPSGIIAVGRPRTYCVEIPRWHSRSLELGDVIQVAVRIGDGVKWSSWVRTKELAYNIPPPKVAPNVGDAEAKWAGDVCTVKWPSATAGLNGLGKIEYHLIAEPDSEAYPARLSAIITGQARDSDAVGPLVSKCGALFTPEDRAKFFFFKCRLKKKKKKKKKKLWHVTYTY
eukprot:NODE_18280_length_901_cov_2.235142.p1 GENE.NODE_18280_length_901_cov_2.235142~~NODE_18280_length_901_cov_2.235142.p1  ORF type:complete len:211 (-),score=40.60 NODE_18280_length_901_cov_2.235142:112-744(-)